MFEQDRIYIAGHTGLLGRAILAELQGMGCDNLITRTHEQLDLTNQGAVVDFFEAEKPEYVFLAAAKVGGIVSNRTYPADFLRVNLAIQNNVFEAAHHNQVKNLVFYGSSCCYPGNLSEPIGEAMLQTGPIEKTSEAYAAAKTAGVIGCKAYNQQFNSNRFIALVPASMYGPGDNFDRENSHVLSALIRKFHDAKVQGARSVTLWGSGNVKREFIFSADVARASIYAMQNFDLLENRHYNIGTGRDYSIGQLAGMIAQMIEFDGEIIWDTSMPDGTERKLLDSADFNSLGFRPNVDLKDGLSITYQWFCKHEEEIIMV